LRHPGWLWLHEARLPAVATTAFAPETDEEYERRLRRLLELAYPGRPPSIVSRDHLALARSGVGLIAPLAERAAGIFVNSEAARRAVLLDLAPLAWAPPIVVLPPACPPLRPAADRRDSGLAVAFGVVSMGKRPDLLVDAAASAGVRLAFVGPCPPVLEQVIRERAERRGTAAHVTVEGPVTDDEWWAWMARADVAVQLRDSFGGEMSAAVLDALSAGVPVLTNLASAGDYPPGTVEGFAGLEVVDLGDRLGSLMADSGRRARLSAAGSDFAAANQMVDLVRKVAKTLLGPALSRP
ncbi:MAG TPA: glycosyltransferase, partial [Acidimicrobiales bacterium]|nr:glycosyltransferase [Acidimicrobiales bacterium]